jgi:acyl carrier protein phosphodiesterase
VNFLAHAYLAGSSDHAIVGSLMGDFVKGPLRDRYGAEITHALALHRRIDTYTDSHHVVRQSRRRVSPPRRRFAGILVDMFYDHFLARHWDEYNDMPLERFAARVYAALREHHALLPERLQAIAPRMAATDWLASYRHVEAVGFALDRMGQRLKRGNALLRSSEELLANYDAFDADFHTFFPEVVRFARADDSPRAIDRSSPSP